MNIDNFWFALGLTVLAGLSTAIGSALAFFTKGVSPRFLSVSLGFSAGVMIYVSMVEIFSKARESLSGFYGDYMGLLITTISFFAGIAVIAVIDKFVPSFENPHEIRSIKDMDSKDSNADKNEASTKNEFYRMGIFSAIAIGIHNFPEGLATFVAALDDPALGISIAVAIAIHNIPEGIAVSVPIYYATGSRKKAFGLSALSGLAEPVGALVGFFLLYPFMNDAFFGILFASVAGIMVYISLDELLPAAEKYGEHHLAIYGLISGMAVMAVSLVLFV